MNTDEQTRVNSVEVEKKEEKVSEINAEQYNELKKISEGYLDLLRRTQAEFDNYKKKVEKDKEQLIKYANEKLILQLIDVYENLERALNAAEAEDNGNKETFLKGLEMTFNQFRDVLEKNGLQPIKAVGEKFDPFRHEAMMTTPADEYEENTVIEEFQRGYTLNGRVIRYSKVRVAKAKTNDQNQL